MIGFLRRHWLLLLLLAAGITLRVLTWLAYQPALVYIDSFRYLSNLLELRPTDLNPLGYTVMLRAMLHFGGLEWAAAVQHVLGVLMALTLYRLTLRYTRWTWLAAIVAAPVLLDAYQLQIEEQIMSEILFQLLLVGFLWLLIWKGEPRWWHAALAGVLVAGAVMTRTIGITVIVPMVLYLFIAGSAWRTKAGWKRIGVRVVAGLVGFGIVLGGYGAYFKSHTGYWGITGSTSNVLYGRASVVADCAQLPQDDPTLLRFCPTEPLDERKGIDFYTHFQYGRADWPGPLPPGRSKAQLASEFAREVIKNQPIDFTLAILKDFAKNFDPVKETAENDVPVERWQFQTSYPMYQIGGDIVGAYYQQTLRWDGIAPRANVELASFLRSYQLGGGYTWGPLLAVFGVLGILGAVGVGRARRSGLQSPAFLATASGTILLLGSAAFEFSWRYQLPALVLLPIGGALGLAAMLGGGKDKPGTAGKRFSMGSFPDDVDSEAVEEFRERYGEKPLTPLVVVIAAYNEAKGIATVLHEMPTHCGDLPVSTLVVVDGATDDTAEIAAEHGAYVCVAKQNRGQGGALRLGYHLAAMSGAEWVLTTDADGQYDNGEMDLLVKPLLEGSADFVTGSRRLGSHEHDSTIRWVGVRVFSWLASVLTLRKITDTSFGFRAMSARLATSVTLREPQYQSSELMLGVMARKARVLEVPMSMRLRNNGKSKKGRSLKYGFNYARVMTGTWWREYVLGGGRRNRFVPASRPQGAAAEKADK